MDAGDALELLKSRRASSLAALKEAIEANGAAGVHSSLVAELCEQLSPDLSDLRWGESARDSPWFRELLHTAVAVFRLYSGDGLPLMALLAAYMNPHVPWSNAAFADICSTIDMSRCRQLGAAFTAYLQPRMVITKEPQLRSVKSSSQRYSKMKGLRPALGFSPSTASQDQERSQWKASANVLSLSQVQLLLLMDGQGQATCGTCSTFILQVLDDSDPLLKTQALFLLSRLLETNSAYLVTSGLVPLYKEEVKICLTYLPQLTPAEASMRLMTIAYPCLYSLVGLENSSSSYTPYVEIIVSHLMGSISHVSRSKDRATNELLAYFLDEISGLIEKNVGRAILVCLSRLFFSVNQLITDPFLIDFDAGPAAVDAALRVQRAVLKTFQKAADPEGSALILAYKYDLLACWAVLAKRILSFDVGTRESRLLLRQNFSLLHAISTTVPNSEAELEEDKQQVLEKVPELAKLLVDEV